MRWLATAFVLANSGCLRKQMAGRGNLRGAAKAVASHRTPRSHRVTHGENHPFEPSPMDVLSRALPLRRFSSSAWPPAGVGSRGPIPRERNPCLAERTAEPGWTLPLPAVPREGTARLHAAEEHSHRFQPTKEPKVILACSRAGAHFLVSIAKAGAPVRSPQFPQEVDPRR